MRDDIRLVRVFVHSIFLLLLFVVVVIVVVVSLPCCLCYCPLFVSIRPLYFFLLV